MRLTNDKPIIGILNSVSELNPCNLPLRHLADAVKAGVEAAGSIRVEMAIRANPIDGVVLLGNCDKTIPAQLMGAASANLPALQLSGGYPRTGQFHGQILGAGTDLWKYWDERRAG